MGFLIVGGLRHPCDATVVDWYTSRIGFEGLPQREAADLIVLGCTSTDQLAAEHVRALRTRRDKDSGKPLGLSAHFFVDHRGVAHQLCDALARASLVGRVNKRAVFIELSNRSDANRSVRGVTRELVREEINAETSIRTALTAPQMHTAIALVECLSAALGIPCAVPMDGAHVVSSVLPQAALDAHKGTVGRYQLELRRADPGLAVLRALAAKRLRERAGPDE